MSDKKKIVSIAASGDRLYVLLESGRLFACKDDGEDVEWELLPHPEEDGEGDEL